MGNTYTYSYEGKTETRLHGSSEQWTSIKIQSTADIEVLSQCEFALKVRQLNISTLYNMLYLCAQLLTWEAVDILL